MTVPPSQKKINIVPSSKINLNSVLLPLTLHMHQGNSCLDPAILSTAEKGGGEEEDHSSTEKDYVGDHGMETLTRKGNK